MPPPPEREVRKPSTFRVLSKGDHVETGVKNVYVCPREIVALEPKGGKTYVNLPADAKEPLHGREVTIKTRLRPAKAGIKVYFTLVPGKNNKKDLPADAQAKLEPETAETDAKGWAQTKLKLSTYGGDEFRIRVACKPDAQEKDKGVKQTAPFVVWRRLKYGLVDMKYPSTPDLFSIGIKAINKAAKLLKPVFIELQDSKKREQVDYKYVRGPDVPKWVAASCPAKEPGLMWFVAVGPMVIPVAGSGPSQLTLVTDKVIAEEGDFLPEAYFLDDGTWFESVEVKPPGGAWQRKDQVMGKASQDYGELFRPVHFSFKGTGITPTPEKPVDIRIALAPVMTLHGRAAEGAYALVSIKPFRSQPLPKGRREYGTPEVGPTIAHELGHLLGLSAMSASAWYDQSAKDAHCSRSGCLMAGGPKGAAGKKFDTSQPGCSDFLRAADLTPAGLDAAWKKTGIK